MSFFSIRTGLALLAVCVYIFVFFPVWTEMVNTWLHSEEYSHGFFIAPLSLFLVWRKKDKLNQLPVRSSWFGLMVAFAAMLAFLVGHFGHISTLRSLSVILFLAGSILFLLGPGLFRELLFPIFLLLFMIPVPSQIFSAATIQLQLLVSQMSSLMASRLGVPLFREGNVIHLADQTLQVVQACSGLRSLISLLALSAVFGYLTLHSNLLRGMLFLSGVPIAVFVNIVRVFLLITFLHFFDLNLTHGDLHTRFGLVIFALALVLLYAIKGVLARWDTASPHD